MNKFTAMRTTWMSFQTYGEWCVQQLSDAYHNQITSAKADWVVRRLAHLDSMARHELVDIEMCAIMQLRPEHSANDVLMEAWNRAEQRGSKREGFPNLNSRN